MNTSNQRNKPIIPEGFVAMGYIKAIVGVKGWVKVHTDTEFVDGLLDYDVWHIGKDNQWQDIEIETGKVANGVLQVKFTNIDTPEAAMLLRGSTICIARENLETPAEDEFYWMDLIGMSVVNREDQTLGTVKNLLETGAHDVLDVQGEHGQKLIPFISHFVDTVNRESNTITVDWGLDY